MANPTGRGKTWSDREVNFLIENWGRFELSALSDKLCRTEQAIKCKSRELDLPFKTRINAAHPSVVDYIKQNAGKISAKDMALETGYTRSGVYNIAYKQGISLSLRG